MQFGALACVTSAMLLCDVGSCYRKDENNHVIISKSSKRTAERLKKMFELSKSGLQAISRHAAISMHLMLVTAQ
jgi:hypothetical protein